LATFEHKKGLDILLRAFSQLAKELQGIDLVISGRAGPEFEAIKSLIQSLGLGTRVSLLTDTPHDQTLALLARAIMLVQPSRREPFGLAILEAAALGVPVVCTDVCGALESLPDGAIVTVPSDDVDRLTMAIRETILNIEAARAKAARIASYVVDNLSWSKRAVARLRIAADTARIT
jgi:glycosyltransferase involved in cell wall biosynthesis